MKLCFKSFASGAIVATVGVATVFAAGAIQSASFNENKVTLDGKALDLSSQPMVSVVKEGESAFSNYMPVRGVLEQMGYDVAWDGETGTVVVTSPSHNAPVSQGNSNVAVQPVPSTGLNAAALVGAWEYIPAEGEKSTMILGSDGSLQYLIEGKDDSFMYNKGTYAIDGEYIKFTYTYVNNDGKVSTDPISMTVAVTINGDQMQAVFGNKTENYTKLSAVPDLSSYSTADATSVTQPTNLEAEDVAGSWVATTEDGKEYYLISTDGTIEHAMENTDGTYVYDKGTYTIKDNMLSVKYHYSVNNGLSSTDTIEMTLMVEFGENGELFITAGNYVAEFEASSTNPDFSKYE